MTTTRRSLILASLDKYAAFVIGILMMAVVSRILTPSEIGLFLVASAVVVLAETLRDFGISACLVHEREVSDDLVRTTFTVMTGLSLSLAILLLAASGPIAQYYGEPRLAGLLYVATLPFFAAPFSNPLLGLLRREMAFGTIARINIIGTLVNATVGVSLAVAGFGAASLIWASVLGAFTVTLLTVRARAALWMFRPCLRERDKVVSFGAYSSAVTILGLLYDFVPRLVLGRLLGFDAVGLYGRALSLAQLPERTVLGALQPVVLPAFAAHLRQGGELRRIYLDALGHASAFHWPILVTMALLAEPIVAVLLGRQWLETIPLVRTMAVAFLLLFPNFLTFPLLISLGRVRDTLLMSLLWVPASLAIIIIAAHLGLDMVAFSFFLTAPLQTGIGMWFVRRHIGVTWGEIATALWRSAAVTGCAAVAPALALAWTSHSGSMSIAEGIVAGLGAGLGWLAGLQLTRHPLWGELIELTTSTRQIVSRYRFRLP